MIKYYAYSTGTGVFAVDGDGRMTMLVEPDSCFRWETNRQCWLDHCADVDRIDCWEDFFRRIHNYNPSPFVSSTLITNQHLLE